MQTTYEKTSNIIDLAELRRQRDSLARQAQPGFWTSEEAPAFRPAVLTAAPEERRRARRERYAWRLDVCASLAVIVMTAIFALRMLL